MPTSETMPEPVALLRDCLERVTQGSVATVFVERARGRSLVYGWWILFGNDELWFDLVDYDLTGIVLGRYREWPCRDREATRHTCDALRRLLSPS